MNKKPTPAQLAKMNRLNDKQIEDVYYATERFGLSLQETVDGLLNTYYNEGDMEEQKASACITIAIIVPVKGGIPELVYAMDTAVPLPSAIDVFEQILGSLKKRHAEAEKGIN